MDLLIATRNRGKAAEFRQMLADFAEATRDLNELTADDGFEPEETGRTFRENACLKASAYAKRYGCHALADDSGLAADALDGAPGVFSARFAEMNNAGTGEQATRDADNNAYVLRRLRKVPDEQRTASFVCVLAIADPIGRILYTAQGSVTGRILHEPRGSNGFGYDPLFFHEPSGCTTAELSGEAKHAISHRGAALRRLRTLVDRHGLPV